MYAIALLDEKIKKDRGIMKRRIDIFSQNPINFMSKALIVCLLIGIISSKIQENILIELTVDH